MTDTTTRRPRDLAGLSSTNRTVGPPPPRPVQPAQTPPPPTVAPAPTEADPALVAPSSRSDLDRRRPTKRTRRVVDDRVSLSLRTHHPAIIEAVADRDELFNWEALEAIIDRQLPKIREPLAPERRRPKRRADAITYTIKITGPIRERIDNAATELADGDRSHLIRALLDSEAAA